MTKTIATICTGGGILEQGAIRAGLKPIWGVEIDPLVADLYRLNYRDSQMVNQDATTVMWKLLSPPDFLHASPSCRNYSILNNNQESDRDIAVAEAVSRAIANFQPEVFTLENVTKYRDSKSWQIILDRLKKLRYSVSTTIVNCKHWGVPQKKRLRFIAIARLEGEAPKLVPPNITQFWYPLIEDLIPQLAQSKLTNTQIDHLTDKTKVAIANKETVLLKRNQIRKSTGCAYKSEPECWSVTATLCTDHRQNKRSLFADLVMDDNIYSLNSRALARIQTIPDTYKLSDNTAIDGLAIGDGVPSLFAQQMFEQILSKGLGKHPLTDSTSPALRGQARGLTACMRSSQAPTCGKANRLCYPKADVGVSMTDSAIKLPNKIENRIVEASVEHARSDSAFPFALLRLTQEPYLEQLAMMPESDLAAEGGICDSVDEFIDTYFKGDRDLKVWVIRFEVTTEVDEADMNSAFPSVILLGGTQNAPSVDTSKLREGAKPTAPPSKNIENGYISEKLKRRANKEYRQYYYRYYWEGVQKEKYLKPAFVGKIREAISQGTSVSEILILLGGTQNAPSVDTSKSREGAKPTAPPSKRFKGRGTGYIEQRSLTIGQKTYTQYWFHYEIWSGGKCQKKSKYIPNKKCDRISKMNFEKEAVSKILKALRKSDD